MHEEAKCATTLNSQPASEVHDNKTHAREEL